MPGHVVALHLKPSPGKLREVHELTAVAGKGFVGDRTYGKPYRQALLTSTHDLADLGLEPGSLREQITVDEPMLQTLKEGTLLTAGTVQLKIESVCKPCDKMARRLGEEPKEFKARAAVKRGMLAKVVSDGVIKVGDEVHIQE